MKMPQTLSRWLLAAKDKYNNPINIDKNVKRMRSPIILWAWCVILQVNEMVNKGEKNALTVWFHANIREYSQYPFMKLLIPALNAFILKEHGLLPI